MWARFVRSILSVTIYMIRKEGNLAGLIRITAFVILLFLSSTFAQAASLYFSPSAISRPSGQNFSAVVRVNTEGQSINAAQGSIVYDPARVEVTSISKSGSIFNLWTQEPVFSNSEGTLNFEGGLPNPGYSGASGLIITVSFRTKGAGNATSPVSLVSGAILANDGQGTNILTNLGKLTVSITGQDAPSQTETSEPVTPSPASDTPQVESSTHADQTKWYSSNDPQFSWSLPSDVTGVSYLVTDKATSNPGPQSDGVVNKATFTDIADGIQYLHVKFRRNGVWGTIAHYQFNIDTAPPADFDVRLDESDPKHPAILFETTDALSGIDHYEVQVGDGTWLNVSAEDAGKPYQLVFNRAGVHAISVKAVDKAGNITTETASVTAAEATAGTVAANWLSKGFNALVNSLSTYGLRLLLLAAFIGLMILLFQLLGTTLDKAWHHMQDRRVIRKNERKAYTTFDHLINDMKDEIKFLDAIGKRRHLGPEEKYLKGKLQQYLKALKHEGR